VPEGSEPPPVDEGDRATPGTEPEPRPPEPDPDTVAPAAAEAVEATPPPAQEASCAAATSPPADGAAPPGDAPPSGETDAEGPPAPKDCTDPITEEDERKSTGELRLERRSLTVAASQRYELGPACERDLADPGCPLAVGLSSTPVGGQIGEASPSSAPARPKDGARVRSSLTAQGANEKNVAESKLALARTVLRQLRNTRAERGEDGRLRPMGVVIPYSVRVCGFESGRARVFWSMFHRERRRRLPYVWNLNRLADERKVRPERCEPFDHEIWVPLPALNGRFEVVVGVGEEVGDSRDREFKTFRP
jgi:hypothetical protein